MTFDLLQAGPAREGGRAAQAAQLVLVLDVLMLGLLLALFLVFFQNYRRLKTPFGLGLVVFAGALLLQSLASVLVRIFPSPAGFVVLELAPSILGIVAIVALLYLVLK
jgi:hypothetical protein